MGSLAKTHSAPAALRRGAVTLSQCVALLEARRLQVCGELGDFPQPVAACDADFNALLAERAAIVAALAELRPISRAEAHVPHPREDHDTKILNQ